MKTSAMIELAKESLVDSAEFQPIDGNDSCGSAPVVPGNGLAALGC